MSKPTSGQRFVQVLYEGLKQFIEEVQPGGPSYREELDLYRVGVYDGTMQTIVIVEQFLKEEGLIPTISNNLIVEDLSTTPNKTTKEAQAKQLISDLFSVIKTTTRPN